MPASSWHKAFVSETHKPVLTPMLVPLDLLDRVWDFVKDTYYGTVELLIYWREDVNGNIKDFLNSKVLKL